MPGVVCPVVLIVRVAGGVVVSAIAGLVANSRATPSEMLSPWVQIIPCWYCRFFGSVGFGFYHYWLVWIGHYWVEGACGVITGMAKVVRMVLWTRKDQSNRQCLLVGWLVLLVGQLWGEVVAL